jgi:xeroderma pigmentosum group C-complementing protein
VISRRGSKPRILDYDWFKMTMRAYTRSQNQRTVVDDKEEAGDLVPNQPEKKAVKDGDTLQSLRASDEFVLPRFLRREEALRPNAEHVRTFVSGKGDKAKEEKVYLRKDVLKCLSAETWHKDGRQVRKGEVPLKRVPIRAVTLMRKREVDELERETGEKPLQGLYARYQTEWIVPPPIKDGVIPKNEYGNIDCFVPSMVPRGAAHIPYSGTVRVCRKLGIDFAEAVTGFEFGSKMAVPVITGVVVAEENAGLVVDAWRADQKARREKERLQQEKRILQTWRKFLMGLRIAERVRAEYGDGGDAETHNPFTKVSKRDVSEEQQAENVDESHRDEDLGGGFLLPGEDVGEEDGFVVEHENPGKPGPPPLEEEGEDADKDKDPEEEVYDMSDGGEHDEYQPPQPRRRRMPRW